MSVGEIIEEHLFEFLSIRFRNGSQILKMGEDEWVVAVEVEVEPGMDPTRTGVVPSLREALMWALYGVGPEEK